MILRLNQDNSLKLHVWVTFNPCRSYPFIPPIHLGEIVVLFYPQTFEIGKYVHFFIIEKRNFSSFLPIHQAGKVE